MNEDRATRYQRLKRQASLASLMWGVAFLGGLLEFLKAVHELGDATVHDLRIMAGVVVVALQFDGAFEIALGPLPFDERGAMSFESALDSFGSGFGLFARAAATSRAGTASSRAAPGRRWSSKRA